MKLTKPFDNAEITDNLESQEQTLTLFYAEKLENLTFILNLKTTFQTISDDEYQQIIDDNLDDNGSDEDLDVDYNYSDFDDI